MSEYQDAFDATTLVPFLTVFLVGDIILFVGLLIFRKKFARDAPGKKRRAWLKETLVVFGVIIADMVILFGCTFVAVYPCAATRMKLLHEGYPDPPIGNEYSSISQLAVDVVMPYEYINYPYSFDRSILGVAAGLLYDSNLNLIEPAWWVGSSNTYVPYQGFVDQTQDSSYDRFAAVYPDFSNIFLPENMPELLCQPVIEVSFRKVNVPLFLRNIFSDVGLHEYDDDVFAMTRFSDCFRDVIFANTATVAVARSQISDEEARNDLARSDPESSAFIPYWDNQGNPVNRERYRLLAVGQEDVDALAETQGVEVYHIAYGDIMNCFRSTRYAYLDSWIEWSMIGFAILFVLFMIIAVVQLFISERKLLRQQRDLLVSITHEMKTPMQVIRMYGDQLRQQSQGSPALLETANQLCAEIHKMDTRLLEISRYNKLDTLKLRKTTFRLDEVLIDIADEFAPLMEDKDIELNIDDVEPRMEVSADEDRIRMAIHNLLSNAVKFTPEQGEIIVSLGKMGKRVRLTVFNSGSRVPEKRQRLIWQAFVKADTTKDNAMRGTGLGLPIVSGIVRLHRGRCGSVNTSDGVAFWFEIPGK